MTENITVNEQSSIRIEGSMILYFDPFRITDDKHDADIIFITHEHYDHFEPESIEKVKNEHTILVAPVTMKKIVSKKADFDLKKCRFYEPSTVHEIGKVVIETVPAYNRMRPYHSKRKQWLGYVVRMDGRKYFIAGDTDMNDDNWDIRCDIAFLPIGGKYTMDKKRAAEYIAQMRPLVVIPTHYGEIVGKKTDGEDFKALVKKLDVDTKVELKLYR